MMWFPWGPGARCKRTGPTRAAADVPLPSANSVEHPVAVKCSDPKAQAQAQAPFLFGLIGTRLGGWREADRQCCAPGSCELQAGRWLKTRD